MLRLVAEHADQWNAAWFGRPEEADELRTRLTSLRAALDEAGRDPTTLEITAGIFVVFDGANDADLTPLAAKRAIHGSPDEVASALAGYSKLGVSHLIVHVWPRTPDAVTRLAEAAALARDRVRSVAAR